MISTMKHLQALTSVRPEETDILQSDSPSLSKSPLTPKLKQISSTIIPSQIIIPESQAFDDEKICDIQPAYTDDEQSVVGAFLPNKSFKKPNKEENSQFTTNLKVLHFFATERLYATIHNYYLTPEKPFENKAQICMNPKNYIAEKTFAIGTNPPPGPNAIKLFDKALSEHHANIHYRDSQRPYFTFFLCLRKIYGPKSLITKLPDEIHLMIQSFIGNAPSYYLQDNGSKTGTYEKISSKHPVSLKDGQEFQLSMDTTIRILQVNREMREKKKTTRKAKDESFDKCKKTKNMLKCLMKEGCVKLIGLNPEFMSQLYTELPSFRKNSNKETRNLNWKDNFDFNIPFLKLEVHEQREAKISKYLIFAMEAPFDYLIGRNEWYEIFLSSPTCSRKHCKIAYDDKKKSWNISDGVEGLPSLGGTWRSLQTTEQKAEKKPSEELPINHGAKFRLGDNVYEFLYTRKKVKLE